jgi:YesN/AraC family two-component response regulator
MELYIKNMVSLRCKLTVKYELEKLGLQCTSIEYGKVGIVEYLSYQQINAVRFALSRSGLQLIDDKKSILIQRIKNVIIEVVHHSNDPLKTNFSNYLSEKLSLDYTYLANIFSEVNGTTIENFIILNKIFRVKELIRYNELNLTQISLKMHYSSVAHLSTQFKKVTGITPSHFKQTGCYNSVGIENV